MRRCRSVSIISCSPKARYQPRCGGFGWNVTFPRYQPRCGRASVTVVATTGQYANQMLQLTKLLFPRLMLRRYTELSFKTDFSKGALPAALRPRKRNGRCHDRAVRESDVCNKQSLCSRELNCAVIPNFHLKQTFPKARYQPRCGGVGWNVTFPRDMTRRPLPREGSTRIRRLQ